jgi:hypothetical protein
MLKVVGSNSDGNEDCSNVDSGSFSNRLSEGTSHTLLESIGSSAGKHFIDSKYVPRVNSDSHVEGILTSLVLHVLVSSNTGSFEGF